MSLSKRDHIVEKSILLFDQCGFHATGIDTIQAYTGVSKKTLYHHFRSKDELILACLRHQDSVMRNQFARKVMDTGHTAEERLVGLWSVLGDWFADPAFHGCIFTAALYEYPEGENPIHLICQEYKKLTKAFLGTLIADLKGRNDADLTDELFLLMEGATAAASFTRGRASAETACLMMKRLLSI